MYDIEHIENSEQSIDNITVINQFLELIKDEYIFARSKHHGFHSFHEGYGVIKEEFDELWDEIRKQEHDKEAMGREAIQVGAMILAYLVELLPGFVSDQ